MKRLCLLLVLLGPLALSAQKNPPSWAAGIYGGLSAGYLGFTQPFENKGGPFVTFPASGLSLQWDGGMVFRNRWGLRLLIDRYVTKDLRPYLIQKVSGEYPGFIVTDHSENSGIPKSGARYGMGVSYAFPRKRWCFQPELLAGYQKVQAEAVYLQVKEVGTHQVFILQYAPTAASGRQWNVFAGLRAQRYMGAYWGFFADARLSAQIYRLPYQRFKTIVLNQSRESESFTLKGTAFGGGAAAGIFLQIGRWE